VPITLKEAASVPLAIPESITVGARHQLNDSVTVLAGATYARWSRFEGLDVFSTEGDGGQISQALGRTGDKPLSHVTEKWQNTWQFNVGGIWQATPAWAFKAGYAWDESPVGEFVTARVPSSDRHWLTLGTQWKDAQSGWTVDAAIGTLLFVDDPKVNEFVYKYDAPIPEAFFRPVIEDFVDRIPFAERVWQISPGHTGPHSEQNAFDCFAQTCLVIQTELKQYFS
jgi:long-chain fatty acid transport protein